MKFTASVFFVITLVIGIGNASAQTKAPTPTPTPSFNDIYGLKDALLPLSAKDQAALDVIKVPNMIELGKYDEAIAILSKNIESNDTNAFLRSYRALAYYYKKEAISALLDATAALKTDPNEVRALNVRAMIERDRGKTAAAKRDFDLAVDISSKAIIAHPGSMDDYFARGETYRLMGENAKAAADYRKTLELSPAYSYADTHLRLVTVAAKPAVNDDEADFKAHSKEFDRLEPLLEAAGDKADAYENALTADNKKNNRYAYFRAAGDNSLCTALAEYGAIYDKAVAESFAMSDMVESGRIERKSALAVKASDAADTLTDLGGDILTRQMIWKCVEQKAGTTAVSAPAPTDLKGRTKAAIDKKDYDAILSELNGLITKDKKNAEALALRGDVYLAQTKTELARADYYQAIKLSPKTSMFYYKRGMSFEENPGYDQQATLNDLNKAIELDNTNIDAHRQRGVIYASQTKYAEAKLEYLEILKADPNDANANYNVGHYFVKENNADEAINYFTRSIKADPKFPYVYVERGQVYEFLKKYKDAVADYSKVVELLPGQGIGYANRADAYAGAKLYAEAINDYSKIISMPDRSSSDYLRRGDIYVSWGKYDEALADYQSAMSLSPNDPAPKKHYNDLVPIVNAARTTAKELSDAFNPAMETYKLLEKELSDKMDVYLALKQSKAATPATGKSPLCYQILDLKTLTDKTIAAFAPMQQLYDQGKLKGYSDQIDYVENRGKRLDNTKKMLNKDFTTFSCGNKVYYVE